MEATHQKFMQMAIELSLQNIREGKGGPFGAVITKNDILIAKSANTVTSTNDPTAHAEVACIRLACQELNTFDLSGCVIYTSCEPCPMCLGAIYWAKIGHIYFANTKADAEAIGFADKFIYNELDRPMADRQLPFTQLMRSEAQQVFQQWDISDSRKLY